MPTIPPYPGLAGFPLQFASDGRSFRPDPNTSDTKNLLAYGEKIWNESHAVDPTLGGAAYGSAAWTYQFTQNGKANSVAVPLPFPNMIGWETFFPKYTASATKEDFAPGEVPFDQCSQYFSDGNLAVGSFNLKWSSLGEGDYLPGTRLTKAMARDNVKIDTRLAAIAYGCTNLPFPEVAGKTLAPEGATYNPPPPATLTDGSPNGNPNLTPTEVEEGPTNANGPVSGVVPTGSSDLPGPSTTVPAGSSTADRPNASPSGPVVTGGGAQESAGAPLGTTLDSLTRNPATWVLIAVALVVLTSKRKG